MKSVDPSRLSEIVAPFAAVSWPAPREQMLVIGEQLGWALQSDRARGMDFTTPYAIGSPRADVLVSDGGIAQVNIDLTDRIRDADAAEVREFVAIARTARDALTVTLGTPIREQNGDNARYTWDLDNGGRVAIAKLNRVVQLIVLQQRYADIERGEERHGV